MSASVSNQDILAVMRAFRQVSKNAKKEGRKILRAAAKPLIQEIQSRAPESEKAHYRYDTAKIAGGLRAPKGSGNIVATYQPGNLAASFKVLPLNRTTAVIVGAKVDKKGKSNVYGPGSKTDGYYAHMVEFGTISQPAQPFVRPALQATQGEVLKIAIAKFKKYIEDYNKKA